MSRLLRFASMSGCALLAACGPPAGQPRVAPGTGAVAGTYAIVVCRERCSLSHPEQSLARGHLVLEDTPYAYSGLPVAVRAYLERHISILTALDAGDAPNACFALTKTAGARTYAGIAAAGVTRWTADTTFAVEVPLFHSPDAGYVARVHVRRGELHGTGESWASGTGDPPFPRDSILGRRIGPPNRSLCIRAAEAQVASRGH